jgi:hypothetical protein
MKAYIKVVYSSDGKSPAKVEGILNDHGFHKVSGQQAFEAEVTDTDYTANLESLHAALKGTGARYMLTSGKPSEGSSAAVPSCGDRLERWRETGIDVDELSHLLENDTANFRQRAAEMTAIQFERIAAEREKELRDIEAIKKAEAVKKHAIELMTSSDGHTFSELVKDSGMEEEDLQQMLLDLVENGKIKAAQRGRHVVYMAV